MEGNIMIGLILFLILIILIPLLFLLRIYIHDQRQEKHAILRNYPLLGKMRYILEKMGPELRQYFFNNNLEGKPFNRIQFEFVYKAAKYNSRMIGFGSERDFTEEGYYMVNDMFPKQREEMRVEQYPLIHSKRYVLDNESLFSRKEHRVEEDFEPFLLPDEDAIILGEHTVNYPFRVKGLIGQSAMSYGALGDHAITALAEGLALAGGTWMNTGEGSVSPYHLKGNVNLIMQISSGLFGVRTEDGAFSWERFKEKSDMEQIKAFELKLAQGAKQRGGHVDGSKVTEEIAEIRSVRPWTEINSPNRFEQFSGAKEMLDFLAQMRRISEKPVGTKIVAGNEAQLESYVQAMHQTGIVPDFITVDGSEGGSGATYYELAASVGLPTFTVIPMLDDLLRKYGIRNQTYIIASGKLLTPDKIAMALALGADLINIARGFMMSVGCIMAEVCHTNRCPVGVATTDPKLQKALSIDEKKYRVCNYLLSLREGLFEMAAVMGIDSPTKFSRKHIEWNGRFKEAMHQHV